jgi:hypothetical protein
VCAVYIHEIQLLCAWQRCCCFLSYFFFISKKKFMSELCNPLSCFLISFLLFYLKKKFIYLFFSFFLFFSSLLLRSCCSIMSDKSLPLSLVPPFYSFSYPLQRKYHAALAGSIRFNFKSKNGHRLTPMKFTNLLTPPFFTAGIGIRSEEKI